MVDLNTMDVLASQAGVAINNANLYSSISQKLRELSLVSTYSEQLMGLVDNKDVIKRLFETVRAHFTFDFIGFLLVKKRFHQFFYWSSGPATQEVIDSCLDETMRAYAAAAGETLVRKRISDSLFMPPVDPEKRIDKPMKFSHVAPVIWDEMRFGTAYFGALRKPPHAQEALALLSSLISQTRIALTNTRLYSDMKENYIRTIKALAIAVDAKDTYTHGHSENVMNIAEAIALEMSSDEKWIGSIRDAGLLHDIGKIGIPGYILNKPGPLTYEEFNGIMKTHATLGANIVKDVPFLQHLYSLILHHHEHYNGTGYPEGLRGEDIPLGARILHVADAFEAMTSNRPYRQNLGRAEAVKRLIAHKAEQFDPRIVDTFVQVARKKGWLESAGAAESAGPFDQNRPN
jgi:putative nucleotidyltransferase with HDIG domain